MYDRIQHEGYSEAGWDIFRAYFDKPERYHQYRDRKLKSVRKPEHQKNVVKDQIICLEGVEDECKHRSYTVNGKEVSEDVAFGKHEDRKKDRVYRSEVQGQILKHRAFKAPHKNVIYYCGRSPKREQEQNDLLRFFGLSLKNKVKCDNDRRRKDERNYVNGAKASPFQFLECIHSQVSFLVI